MLQFWGTQVASMQKEVAYLIVDFLHRLLWSSFASLKSEPVKRFPLDKLHDNEGTFDKIIILQRNSVYTWHRNLSFGGDIATSSVSGLFGRLITAKLTSLWLLLSSSSQLPTDSCRVSALEQPIFRTLGVEIEQKCKH